MVEILKKLYYFGDMTCIFATLEEETQFILVPQGAESEVDDDKIAGISPLGNRIDREPMLHFTVTGDGFSRDFTAGSTLRNSDTAHALRLIGQEMSEKDGEVTLVSRFENGKGLTACQYVRYCRGTGALEVYNELENTGETVTVEAFPSFNLSCIPPFGGKQDPSKIILHKLLSNWSGEGKLYSVSTDKLAFESSWSGLGIRTEKWTQTGTIPARGQLPFVAVEDTSRHICWAAAIEAPASWIIESVFRNGSISIGGGMGDFLSAHWRKILKKGEKIRTEKAYLTVVRGGLNEACDRLVKTYDAPYAYKNGEESLPLVYNEYCYSWGTPHAEELLAILPVAKRLGCRYFVVDDGWFVNSYGADQHVIGDWNPDRGAFPEGLKQFCDEVRRQGMVPGLWYEFEGVGIQSEIFQKHPEYMLTYGGKIINHQGRAFLDFRKEEVREYLREKVIQNLVENRIGYMKVDYNENVGLGVDGAESYGEGLRSHMRGVLSFFEEIKRVLPDLVLEICSSGGMRHEPRFIGLADMVSFSDAHANPSGVNVACNLHRYIPPRKMQIWATIRDSDSLEDVCFTVAKAMLGRLCFSGNLANQSRIILEELQSAVAFYRQITPIVKNGKTTVIEDREIVSYLDPQGRVYLIRESLDGRKKLIYVYALNAPSSLFAINVGEFHVTETYHAAADLTVHNGILTLTSENCPLWGSVILLEKNEEDEIC